MKTKLNFGALLLFVAALIGAASCGSKTNENENDSVAVDTVVVDTAIVDSVTACTAPVDSCTNEE